MKKKFLLFTATVGVASLALMSNSGGPAHAGNGNRTGSNGTTANCSTGGCHAANTTATTAAFVIAETSSPSTPITSYVPGRKYSVTLGATNTSASLSKFGFQASVVKESATNTQAGTWGTGTSSNIMAVNVGGISVMEHMGARSVSTVPGAYFVTFEWTAPAAGTGNVKFFGIVNVVNGNGATSGDAPNATTTTLTEVTTSVASVGKPIGISTYPSPAINKLQLNIEHAASSKFDAKVIDMAGRVVLRTNVTALQPTLDVAQLSAGQYVLVLNGNDEQGTVRFVKQ